MKKFQISMMMGVLALGMCQALYAVSLPMNASNWTYRNTLFSDGNQHVFQESDGVLFRGATTPPPYNLRHGGYLLSNASYDFSNAILSVKFMANGSGQFMDSNVGLAYDEGSAISTVGGGSRYTTGNSYGSYMLTDGQWYYATLAVTPDQKFTMNLYQNDFAGNPGSILLHSDSGSIDLAAWTHIHEARIALSIGDNRNWYCDQWMKIGSADYANQTIPVGTPIPVGSSLIGVVLSSLAIWKKRKK